MTEPNPEEAAMLTETFVFNFLAITAFGIVLTGVALLYFAPGLALSLLF
jgi:hypothetical protein